MTRLALVHFNDRTHAVMRKFSQGARAAGYASRRTTWDRVTPSDVVIVAGAREYSLQVQAEWAREGRLIQVDNSWLPERRKRAFRMAWNGYQPHYDHLVIPPRDLRLELKPAREERGNVAILALQSAKGDVLIQAGASRDEWAERTSEWVRALGYVPEVREKPRGKKGRALAMSRDIRMDLGPEVGLVVSRTSTSSLMALCEGLPGYCTHPCALLPVCSHAPRAGEAWSYDVESSERFVERLLAYDFSELEMKNGTAIRSMLNVPREHRVGLSPGGIP